MTSVSSHFLHSACQCSLDLVSAGDVSMFSAKVRSKARQGTGAGRGWQRTYLLQPNTPSPHLMVDEITTNAGLIFSFVRDIHNTLNHEDEVM